jgi:hypothetical protein
MSFRTYIDYCKHDSDEYLSSSGLRTTTGRQPWQRQHDTKNVEMPLFSTHHDLRIPIAWALPEIIGLSSVAK